jgi:hypothetical protein
MMENISINFNNFFNDDFLKDLEKIERRLKIEDWRRLKIER